MHILDLREGVSGDMVVAALVDAGAAPASEAQKILETAAHVMDPTAKVILKKEMFHGLPGTTVTVMHYPFSEVSASSMQKHLQRAVWELGLLRIKKQATAVLDAILQAEAEVHGKKVDALHLHETGSPDTLVDIIGACYLMDKIPDEICCTPISAGKGKVTIEHGVFDVPPPAVRCMLQGMHWAPGPHDGEMATPTGVAIVRTLCKGYVKSIPPVHVRLGTGYGSKSFAGRRTSVKLFKA